MFHKNIGHHNIFDIPKLQIEIISGKTETHGSVRLRSIRMAETMKTKGIKKGDVISIAAVNHNDLCIPFLAALYIGAVPVGLTPDMKHCNIYEFSVDFRHHKKIYRNYFQWK